MLAGKCEDSECAATKADLEVVKNCFTDISDPTCQGLLINNVLEP